jgi:hypothetical protein
MSKIEKTSPLLNLQNFQVFLTDTVASSNYFRVSELSDTFTSGKNGFLIEGSPFLKGDTEIKIEVLDVEGNPLFVQPGEGIPEYYEGLSKLVTAHVYQDTPIGIGKITILGELRSYIDENGFEQPIPADWEGIYNVKWERNVKINKNIPNETRVRFIKRPEIEIEELDESFYAKTLVSTAQSSSTVRGYALTPSEGTFVRGYRGAIRYYIENEGGDFKDGATTISVAGTGIQDADVLEYLNQNTVVVRVPYTGSEGTIQSFTNAPYTLNYQYFTNPTESPILGSFGRFSVSNLATFVGDVERLKVFKKSRASNLDYATIQDTRVDSSEILTNVISGSIERVGFFTGSYLDGTNWNTYWTTASSANTSLDSSKIYKAVKFKNNTISSNLGNDLRLYSGSEYTLEYYTLYDSASSNANDSLSVYLTSTLRSGSGIANYYLTQSLENLTGSNEFRNSVKRSINFIPSITDDWILNFKSTTSTANAYWQVGSVSLKSSNELGYSPDAFNFIIPIDRQLEQETFDFKFEFFDINNNYVPIDVFATKQFVSGNIKLIDKEIVVDADKNYFSFDSDLIAIPETQQVNISISKNRVLGDLLITSQAFDSGGVPIPPTSYSALPSPYNKYPGSFGTYSENLYSASAVLTLNSFTGSRHSNPAINNVVLGGTPYGSVIVDRIVYTLTETSSSLPATKNFTIFRQSDGEKDKQVLARANKNQFTYKRTTLEPDPSNQRIVLSIDRLNLPSSSVYPITHTKVGGNLLATLSGSANTSPLTYVLDAGTNAASTFVTGSGYNSTTYVFQQLDRRGVAYTGSVTIDPVVINSPLTVNLSNDNFTLRAKSSLYASQFSTANNDITESLQFTSQKAKVTVNVGGEAIAPAASSTTNRFWITTAVSGCLATTTTGSLAADGIDVGISAFTNNSYEQGLVTVTINYRDALGVIETATKTITFKKQRNSVPTIDLNVNPTSQTLSANSLGAVAGGNTTAGYTTLNVTATENATSRFDRIKSVSQLPVSTITTAISTNSVTLNNMVSGSDSVQLTLDEVHYTFGEGSYGTGSLKSSVTKARKAAPVLKIEVTNKAQSVTAKSTGVQIGTFSNPVVTVSETYDGSTTTKTITALSATSADIATIVTTPGTGTITLNGRTLANGTDGTVVSVSATVTDSEGTSRSVTDTVSLSKIKNAPPTTLVTITPEGQNVASASSGYGAPANFTITVKETTAYSYSTGGGASTYYVSSITGGTNNANGTITPNTPTTDAGTTTTITISYVNSEGVAGSEVKTHKVSVAKEGRQGPGLLFIGDYATKKAAEPSFVLNNNATKKDAVKNAGKFYAFRGADLTTIGATSTPTAGGDSTWEEFTSFSAISTGLLITENSFVQQTLNVGTNAAGDGANITIWGGDTRPYISIGQGTKGYDYYGIFMGYVGTPPNDGFKMSILNTANGKYFKWTGTDLLINAGNFGLDSAGNITANGGTIGGWTINSTNLTSNNGQTSLYNTGYIELRDTQAKPKVTIDYGTTLPDPTAGSDSGTIVIPALGPYEAHFTGTGVDLSLGNPGDVWDMGTGGGTTYGVSWGRQGFFTPTITGYYQFQSWLPKDGQLGCSGSGGGIFELRAYIYTLAGEPLIDDEGREFLQAPVEGCTVNSVRPGFPVPGTYGNQYLRDGTGTYFSNQFLTAGVTYRFLYQWIAYNIPAGSNLVFRGFWPSFNVQYIQNVPKINVNQAGFQVIQDTNRYFSIRPSGWYMYNDPANYAGGSAHPPVLGTGAPPNLFDQGETEVTGIMGGNLVILNATDKEDWHSGKQKTYIRSAQYSFANRAAGGNFITSFFFGGYGRSFNLTRAYGWFTPNSNTGMSTYDDQWWPYAYNIENITRLSYGVFQVTFAEPIMDTYGAYSGGGIYSVFIGRRDGDLPGDFTTAAISNIYHTGFRMDLGNETPSNRFVSILVIG